MNAAPRSRILNRLVLAAVITSGVGVTACHHVEKHHDHRAADAGKPALDEHHAHHGATAEGLVLDNGQKWQTDTVLRRGMTEIRTLIAPFPAGTPLPKEQAQAVADGVRAEVGQLIQQCKLKPEADVVLHVLISDMLQGADALSSGKPATDGLDRIRSAVERYPAYFDHPGW